MQQSLSAGAPNENALSVNCRRNCPARNQADSRVLADCSKVVVRQQRVHDHRTVSIIMPIMMHLKLFLKCTKDTQNVFNRLKRRNRYVLYF